MKSADVAGKATPPPYQTPTDAAGALSREASRRAGATAGAAAARAGAAVATALQRVAGKPIDRLAGDVGRSLGASILRLEPVRAFVVEIPAGHALSVAGYAAAPKAAAGATSGAAAAAGATSASGAAASKGEWAFLDDPGLTIEDKLFRFMKLVVKKSNDELEQKMKDFKAGRTSRTASSSASSAKKSSGGLFGLLKKVFPPLAALEKVIPALPQLVNKLATDLGPQLLGALMIPLGAPWAAPLVQRAAGELLPAAVSAIDGGPATASASSSGSSGGVSKENDERLQLMEIERMVQKTNQMFATVSNVLKATHDAAMTAVNNIR
ncbi:MAG TPA: hypothetical protein VFF02_15540 [Anaeromyxobacteraceae bacterium]|nr:hypothetical protein [Anaeromyxobacteraceae bacterium]